MAGKKPKKPPSRSKAHKEIDAAVLARRQKDLDGFIVKHQEILDQRAAQYAAEITPLWQRIGRNITNEIRAVYSEVQDAQGVPIVGNPIDPAKYRNMQRQIARLRNLQKQLVEMMGTDVQKARLDPTLVGTYAESYYFHAFGLEQAAQVAVNIPVLTIGHVIGAVINPWLPDGATYSDRLRANTQYLADKMKNTVEKALGSGWSINRTAREIQNHADEGYYNAVRLARTEMTRAAAQGANHTYMQNADIMDGKRWNAVLDARTAPKDAQNDGEVFDLDYDTPENPGIAGRRIPNHPNCRCKWSPILSALGISTKERIARGAGDSKTNFGARIYTQARSYKEYAKERGLPDVDLLVTKEDPRRYLRRGETLADIPKHFFDPFSPVITATAVIPAVVAAKTIIASNFTPATSLKEANAWAKDNIPQVKQVDFTGYDLQLANEVNEELHNLFTLYPEIEDVNFVGTAQQRNKLQYEYEIALFKQRNSHVIDQIAKSYNITPDEYAKRYVKKRAVSGNTYAQATNKTWGGRAGITFNQKWAKDYKSLSTAVDRDVKSKWHPEGTEKPVSVLIHEFGHSIDYFLEEIGLREKYLTPITKDVLSMYSVEIEEQLSRYAVAGRDPNREVIAEAFSEYRLNPNPRKWARLVGEAIEQALEEYRKGLK